MWPRNQEPGSPSHHPRRSPSGEQRRDASLTPSPHSSTSRLGRHLQKHRGKACQNLLDRSFTCYFSAQGDDAEQRAAETIDGSFRVVSIALSQKSADQRMRFITQWAWGTGTAAG